METNQNVDAHILLCSKRDQIAFTQNILRTKRRWKKHNTQTKCEDVNASIPISKWMCAVCTTVERYNVVIAFVSLSTI